MLNATQFIELAHKGYSHLPVATTLLADMETPLSIFNKIRHQHAEAYLFESVQGGERWGRYSMIGFGTSEVLEFSNHQLVHRKGDQHTVSNGNQPFDVIRALHAEVVFPAAEVLLSYGLPEYCGGWVGYFGYETVRFIEPKLADLAVKDNPIGLPDILLMRSEQVIVFDNLKGTLSIVVIAKADVQDAYAQAESQLASIKQIIQAAAQPIQPSSVGVGDFVSNTGQDAYQQYVTDVQEYIKAGDVMQVVPSQRMSADFRGDSLAVYRAIRHINPSPYLFYVQGQHTVDGMLQPFSLVGSSPEILSRMQYGTVTVRPLAGTRHRGATPEADAALAAELLADEKEIAEHLMLIDLGRNDVARVSEIGSVKVTEKMQIERYSHVMHIVSNVQGTIRKDADALEVFAATFPAGTLTGAPKIRAMEIIHQLEPVARGVFGGAVGYLGWNGQMDTAIAIRTAVIANNTIHVQAGAGVVADSIALNEWNETLIKARAMIKAVELSANGLNVG